MSNKVFYSFHFERDVKRIQLVRQINALDPAGTILDAQEWESVRRKGDPAVEQWIAAQMLYKKAVIVLIGYETASRPWVQYEVDKAWADKRPLLGIRIHGLSSMGATDRPGPNPFDRLDGGSRVPVFDPTATSWGGAIDSRATYRALTDNIVSWSDHGVTRL